MLRLTFLRGLMIAAILLFLPHGAIATMAIGGSEPEVDHNWPAGCLDVVNHPSGVQSIDAGWGLWMFDYHGDASALNDVLARFAKIQSPQHTLEICAGVTRFDPGPGSGYAPDDRVAWTVSLCETRR